MVRDVATRVCGLQDMKCYKTVEEESKKQDWCKCHLKCGEVVYKTEQKQNEFVE
jgi:hypothetical protein